jgi:hypothetical protein
MQRHRHQEFLRFPNAVEAAVPAGKLVHAVLDNNASHTQTIIDGTLPPLGRRDAEVRPRESLTPGEVGRLREAAAGGHRRSGNGAEPARRPRGRPFFARLAAYVGLYAALALPGGGSLAQGGPQPPCGSAPSPAYGEPGGTPVVRVWAGDGPGAGWTPPACTGWRPLPFRALVAAAGRFRHRDPVEELLARLGAVSTLTTVRYWSVADRRWRQLVTRPPPWTDPTPPRGGRTSASPRCGAGPTSTFAQDDNRSTGEVVYRMRVREVGPDRLVVETENVGAVRYLVVPLAGPGDLQALHFLERLAPGEWGYYGLARTGAGASPLTGGREASYVNRAVALFRHLADLPTDRGPPAAP